MEKRKIVLLNNQNTSRLKQAKELWKLLKYINSETDLLNYIAMLNFYGFDLHNKSNYFNSNNYDIVDLGEDKVLFLYYMSTTGKMKYKNIANNFYIAEENIDGTSIKNRKFHNWTSYLKDKEQQEKEIYEWINGLKNRNE